MSSAFFDRALAALENRQIMLAVVWGGFALSLFIGAGATRSMSWVRRGRLGLAALCLLVAAFTFGLGVERGEARRLSAEQRGALAEAINGACSAQNACDPPAVSIVYKPDDGETAVYGNDLRLMFEDAKWSVVGPSAWRYTDRMWGLGLRIAISCNANQDAATALEHASQLLKIPMEIENDFKHPCANQWNVFVNEKIATD